MGNNTRQCIREDEYSQARAQRRFKGDRAAVVKVKPGFPEELQRTVHTVLLLSQNLMLCELSTICMAYLKPSLNDLIQHKRRNKSFIYK